MPFLKLKYGEKKRAKVGENKRIRHDLEERLRVSKNEAVVQNPDGAFGNLERKVGHINILDCFQEPSYVLRKQLVTGPRSLTTHLPCTCTPLSAHRLVQQ